MNDRWALRLPASNAACAQLAVALAAGLGSAMHWPIYATAAAAATVGVLCTARLRGRLLTDWWTGRLHGTTRPLRLGAAVDVIAEGRNARDGHGTDLRIGIHHEGGELSAVLELQPGSIAATSFGSDSYVGADPVPLRLLAECRAQHDIRLAGIDVHLRGSKHLSGHELGGIYGRLVAPLPAAAEQVTRIALRLDPLRCTAAVARRGGGVDGARRTLVLAALRVQRRLSEHGFTARLLTADEIAAAAAEVTHGLPLDELAQRRRYAPLPGGAARGFAIGARSIASHELLRLWTPDTAATALTLQIRPCSSPDARVKVSALGCYWVRSDGAGNHHREALVRALTALKPPVADVVSLSGRQRRGLRASMPMGGPRLRRLTGLAGLRVLDTAELESLHLPSAGCGQLIGADREGHAVAVRLASPAVRLVRVTGGLHLAQQAVLRAVCVGARVRVSTIRPHAWRPMIDKVGSDRLALAESPLRRQPDRAPLLLVLDGTCAAPGSAGGTILQVHDRDAHDSEFLLPEPDIHIEQLDIQGSRIALTLPGERMELALVSLPEERAYIARPVRPRPALAAP
jgi:type VII secretion protein EccE